MPDYSIELQLPLERCPHCYVAKPLLGKVWGGRTHDHAGGHLREWAAYACQSCGGVVTCAAGVDATGRLVTRISEMYPATTSVNQDIPDRARTYLTQALESIHAPAGSVMLAASAVDAMLKAKGRTSGTLYERIQAAAVDHLITTDMAAWAHDVRLDANDQRHSDDSVALPNQADAKRCVEFAMALAEFLFVLPARVARGRGGRK